MAGSPRKLRTVRRSVEFEDAASDLEPDVKRLDEILEGVEWAVARDPSVFAQVPNSELRIARTDPFLDAPALRVFFAEVDDDVVELRWVEEIPVGDEEDFSG